MLQNSSSFLYNYNFNVNLILVNMHCFLNTAVSHKAIMLLYITAHGQKLEELQTPKREERNSPNDNSSLWRRVIL